MRLFFDRLVVALVNPFDIITNAEGDKTTMVSEGEKSFAEVYELPKLFHLLKREGLIWSVIVILVLLITMLFIKRSDRLADRKEDVLHKLLIVFLISSTIFILSTVVNIFDTIF